jgi:hypothetical protein
MLRLLTAIGSFLSMFAFIATGPETRPSLNNTESDQWSVAMKAHDRFRNWT